jgi:hypothetical protein
VRPSFEPRKRTSQDDAWPSVVGRSPQFQFFPDTFRLSNFSSRFVDACHPRAFERAKLALFFPMAGEHADSSMLISYEKVLVMRVS